MKSLAKQSLLGQIAKNFIKEVSSLLSKRDFESIFQYDFESG